MTLRYYQEEAIEAVFDYWATEDGNALVDLATGTGKSMVQAALTQRLVTTWTDMRVCCVTHVVELVEGNYLELLNLFPFADAGVYAASLGQRAHWKQIVFAQLQTVWNKAAEIGHIDVLMIDEVHLVPRDADTMYGKFIKALLAINPDLKIVGFSATVYRLDSGRLDEGEERLFDKVVYEYGIGRGIADGYLAPLSSKPTTTAFDLTGVGTLGGDYKKGALAAAVDKEEVTRAAIAEVIAKASDRRTGLFFCSGVDHAYHVRDEVRRHGKTCETIHGGTPPGERRAIIEALRSGDLWAASNDAVLTTGTNIVGIDFIADLAPTKSLSRYVQKAGRGTRPLYAKGFDLETVEGRLAAIAASVKPNCLYLDYAKNVEAHGPVDMVQPRAPGKGSGEAPVKVCPECEELIHISVMKCTCCGYDFPPSEDVKITKAAAVAPILSTAEPEWYVVTSRTFREHFKDGMPDSIKVAYMMGPRVQNEWLGPEHNGFLKMRADRFWKAHGGALPFPKTADEWFSRATELFTTSEIQLKANAKNRKYMDVVGWRTGEERHVPDDIETSHAAWKVNMPEDDEIPF